MEKEKFNELMIEKFKELNITLTDLQLNQFYEYMNILIEWNKVMNLTGIVEPEEIIVKHFVDSLTICNRIEKNASLIDVGTGAGFPGIPIKIVYPESNVTLLDSLNKRINFLNTVIEKLNLKSIKTIHGRAEDYGKDKKYREQYDVVVARAVAPLNILLEYLMPFAKIKGKCICMKGSNVQEELSNGKNAIKELGGKIAEVKEIYIPNTDIKRNIIEIEKIEKIKSRYPRKAGIPSKEPL